MIVFVIDIMYRSLFASALSFGIATSA